jgi:sigma-B regulation protein RsbU (phosphoserine phosphatase)
VLRSLDFRLHLKLVVKLLVADDDPLSRRLLERLLARDYDVMAVEDGEQAWDALRISDHARLLVLDWMMPRLNGPELCRRVRGLPQIEPCYILLLTAKHAITDIVAGLEAGADDYITKPFEPEELRARVRVGVRVLELQIALAARVAELQQALARVKQLQGLLPICSYCKRIRDDQNYWQQLETYLSEHSEAVFSHGLCPECYRRFVEPDLHPA